MLTTSVALGSLLRVVVTMLGFEMLMPTMVLVLFELRAVLVTNGELLITPENMMNPSVLTELRLVARCV